jgi:hypothetical protein
VYLEVVERKVRNKTDFWLGDRLNRGVLMRILLGIVTKYLEDAA